MTTRLRDLLYFAAVVTFTAGIVLGDRTQAAIQQEGLACFAMASSIPGLKTLTGG
jgi:hypothetical protein